jgi:1-acyl-sn-glycerol-3-phosphate acyltransferase
MFDKLFRKFKKEEKELGQEVKTEERKIEKEIVAEEKKLERVITFEETRLIRWGYSFLRATLGRLIRWLWVDHVEGIHNMPLEGPIIIASNHQSFFDFLCFISIAPRKIHYLAAEKFFHSPFWKILMKMSGQIKVDRHSSDHTEALSTVYSALDQGRVIGIFPEGTRSLDGKLQKAFTGVGKIALTKKVPIIPVGLIGTYEIMSKGKKLPSLKKATIKIGEPMHFKEFHDIDHGKEHYRIVTDKVMLKIAELSGKEYPHIEEIKEEISIK